MANSFLKNARSTAWVIIIGSGLISMAKGMSLAFLAVKLSTEFNLTAAGIGAALGAGPMIGAFTAPVIGPLSDKFGRAALLALILFVIAATLFAIAVTNNILIFVAAQVIGAIAAALYEPLSRALLSEVVEEEDRLRVFSWRFLATSLGWGVGPIIGVVVGAASGLVFALAAIVYVLIGIAFYVSVPASSQHKTTLVVKALDLFSGRAWRNNRLLLITVGSAFLMAVHGQWSVSFSQFFLTTEDGIKIFAMLMSVNALTALVVTEPVRHFIRYWGAHHAMSMGCVLMFISFICFSVSAAPISFILSMIIFTIGETIMSPAEYLLVDEIAPAQEKGAYFGTHSISSIGNFIGPTLGGAMLGSLGGSTMFVMFGVGCLVGAGFFVASRLSRQKLKT